MPSEIEKICLECVLPFCDDRSNDCRLVQIGSIRKKADPLKIRRDTYRRAAKRRRERETQQFKQDLLAILGSLIGEKAIDTAKANAERTA
jgi:hypothetical protein